jgi:hypothetical protein
LQGTGQRIIRREHGLTSRSSSLPGSKSALVTGNRGGSLFP